MTDDKGSVRSYDRSESVVFLRTRDAYGALSNMAGGFPVVVNDLTVPTIEALYQACRYPLAPDIQRQIITEPSPMSAKMRSKKFRSLTRPDWDKVRVPIMRWCLQVKLSQHWASFGELLISTGPRPIVEESRRDDFWGAKPVNEFLLAGTNALGRLLMELRADAIAMGRSQFDIVYPLGIVDFVLANTLIRPAYAADVWSAATARGTVTGSSAGTRTRGKKGRNRGSAICLSDWLLPEDDT